MFIAQLSGVNWGDYGALGAVVAALLAGFGWLVRYLCLKLLSDGKADGSGKGLLVRWMESHEKFVASIDDRTERIEHLLADHDRRLGELLAQFARSLEKKP